MSAHNSTYRVAATHDILANQKPINIMGDGGLDNLAVIDQDILISSWLTCDNQNIANEGPTLLNRHKQI